MKPINIDLDKEFLELDEKAKLELAEANLSEEANYEQLTDLRQGSKAWFYTRLGMFTGSKIPDLMKSGRAKADVFGETAKNVIRKVQIERNLSDVGKELYVDELFMKNFRQTEWGNKYESYARAKYEEQFNCVVEETVFTKSRIIPYIGGSFDGKVVGENKIIEIKCPYDVIKHDDNVQIALDVEEKGFPKNHEYYGQIQCNIFVGEADSCDFISFDPRLNKNNLVVINVPRDVEYISEIIKRTSIANIAVTMFMEFMDVDAALLMATKKYEETAAND